MTSATRLTPSERDRAVGRLRALTIGTAVAGVIATAGLGTVAAVSNPGSSTADGATTAAVGGSSSDSTSTTTTTTTSSSGTSLQAAATPATTSSGQAHVSTGSS